ncbi:MAG: hypothetical protein LQ349_007935 [Xanthoria aureola]|nr:MAG: hypothetical protein LQ349_007935 [Xanthoria aureola]
MTPPQDAGGQKPKAILHPANSPLPQATGNRLDDRHEPTFGTTQELIGTTKSGEGDQYYLNEFDKLLEAQDQDAPLFPNSGGTASLLSDFTMDQGASSSVPPGFAPDEAASCAYMLDPRMELDPSRHDGTVQTHDTTMLEAPSENYLFESPDDSHLSNAVPTSFSNHRALGDLVWPGTPVDAVPLQLLASENQFTQTGPQALASNSLESSHRLPEPVNPTPDFRVSDHDSISDLSVMVNGLSQCSSNQKQFIKDILRGCSGSDSSSVNSSHGSDRSLRLAESSRDRPLLEPARPFNGHLPGDFIVSNVNTFWDHIACNESLGSRCDRVNFCESCCQGQVESGTKETWCIPFAVIQVKRDRLVDMIWCDQGDPRWVDRFGNTSLHIAAALGATYQELRAIFEKGANIHVCNSGRQTFMHLLNPLGMDNDSLISLTQLLRQNNFNFDHRDVLGHTFIDSLELRGWDSSSCAESGPTLVVTSLRRELYDQARTAQVTPPWSDTYTSLLDYSGSINLGELLKTPKVVLGNSKHFEDFHGRNCLHLAAGKAEKPSQVSEQSFMNSRLSLVRDLLSVGVELDHHDNRGETPLMTHIRTIPPQDNIILELLHSGADINLRNKKGETALHISIKLGYIIGTKALLAQGAAVNVHVRTWKEQGLLAVAVDAQRLAKDNVGLYAKITACMALAIDAGAIAAPTILDEWDLREPAREVLRKAHYIVAPKDTDNS